MQEEEIRERLKKGTHVIEVWGPLSKKRESFNCSCDPDIVPQIELEFVLGREEPGQVGAILTDTNTPIFFFTGFIASVDGKNAEEPVIIN